MSIPMQGPHKYAAISFTNSGDLVALVGGRKIRVLSLLLTLAGSQTVKFQSGGTTDLSGAISLIQGVALQLPFQREGWFETVAGEKLNIVCGGLVNGAGCLVYQEVLSG